MSRETAEKVLAIVRSKTQSPVSLESTLDSLGLDSLAMAEIVFDLETAFRIRTDDRLIELRDLREVVDYVEQAIAQRGGIST